MNTNKDRFGFICGLILLLACGAAAGQGLREVKRKAEQGDASAQYQLGRKYSGEKNYREALRWFHQAAGQGHSGALNRLGVMHERGEGVRSDCVEAYRWYTLSGANLFGAANRQALGRRMSAEQLAQGQERAALYLAPVLGCK